MKVQYLTDDNKVFNSEEELRAYEAEPCVYVLIANYYEGGFTEKHILGVYLTQESAEVAKEQSLTYQKARELVNFNPMRLASVSIERYKVESCYGEKKESTPILMWNKFKGLFKER